MIDLNKVNVKMMPSDLMRITSFRVATNKRLNQAGKGRQILSTSHKRLTIDQDWKAADFQSFDRTMHHWKQLLHRIC